MAPRVVFFDDIKRFDDGTAYVRIVRCDWVGDDRKYTEMAAYETASKGAKASARREIRRIKTEMADALAAWAEKFA